MASKVLVYRYEVEVNPATVNPAAIQKALEPFGKVTLVGTTMRKQA